MQPRRTILALWLLCLSALPAGAQTLTIGRASSAAGLDPGFLREPATLVDNVFDTLVGRDDQLKLVPDLALSWSAVDPTTWEFKLRPGVSFQNGEKFDAASVKFSLDRVLDPAAHAPTISYISTIASVDVVDPLTVRIHTKIADPLLPTRMSRYPAYMVPPAYLASVGKDAFTRKPVGTGPYSVTEFVPDDHVTMQAFPGHWRGKPAIGTVVWRALPEPTARVAALLAGEVQLIEGVPVDLVPQVTADAALDLVKVPRGGLIIYLGLKTGQKPLDDVRVRRALSLAIDRRTIVARLLKGFATATGSQAGPFDFGYKDEPVPAYDPAESKKLLTEAGYPNGFSIAMQTPQHYIDSAEVGQVIAQEFAAIGVTAQLEVPEWSVYAQLVPAGKQAPIYMLGWGSTQTLDADAALYPIFHTGEPYSTVSFAPMDALLADSRSTIDPVQRAAIFGKIEDMATDVVPALTLYQEDSLYAKRKTLSFTGRADARVVLFDMKLAQ